jgi:glucose-1-phosphate adenylyltransferase
MPSMNNVLAVILAGGQGTRLYPLTQTRSKPAMPIAGKYRLIDIPISNCINSGIQRIAVLTQCNPESLHRHISNTYNNAGDLNWVKVLTGGVASDCASWYRGTADAVRKQMLEIQKAGAEYVLILAGDHLYQMDYSEMARFHMAKKADITVAVQPIVRSEASRFGVLKRTSDGRISNFVEKPVRPELQDQFICGDNPDMPFLGSMGIYMFNSKALIDLLITHPNHDDFGGDIIPTAIQSRAVYGYIFGGYWQDIGTMRSFYETNLALTRPGAPFHFNYPKSPIYTATLTLPPSDIVNSEMKDVIVGKGCNILNARIEHSVIGVRSQIGGGTVIKDSIVMGASRHLSGGIGSNCHVEGAILDKNARLGDQVIIRPFPRGLEMDCGNWFVRDGIVVIPKNANIPAGTIIAPEEFIFNNAAALKVDHLLKRDSAEKVL